MYAYESTLDAIPPFTDGQNDLHLIIDTAQEHFLYLRLDLAKLIAAATRALSGAHSIGSCEDRSGYVCCRVLHQPSFHCDFCHGLPMRFAGRAFLCRWRGEPHHRGRDVLRAGRVGPRLGLDRCRPPDRVENVGVRVTALAPV